METKSWSVDPSSINPATGFPFDYYIIEDGQVIASTWINRDDEESQKRARLIAAAPEMLGALYGAAHVFRVYQRHHEAKGDSYKAATNAGYAARMEAVIDKATGGAE